VTATPSPPDRSPLVKKVVSALDVAASHLESRLEKPDYRRLFVWPVVPIWGLLTAGMFTSSTVVFWVLGVVLVAYAFTVAFILDLLRRRAVRRIATVQNKSAAWRGKATRYADALVTLQNKNADYFRIVAWKETIHIGAGGDATITRDLTIEVGEEPVEVLWGAYHTDQLPQRNNVRFVANRINDDGTTGVTIPSTDAWATPKKQRVFLHPRQPLPPNTVHRFKMVWNWPGYYQPLSEGSHSSVTWQFSRPCERLDLELVFLDSFGLKALPATSPRHGCAPPAGTYDQGGRAVYTYVLVNPAQGVTHGFDIDTSSAL